MEEEYRMQKAAPGPPAVSMDGSTLAPNGHAKKDGADDDASIRGMTSIDNVNGKAPVETDVIPTIRISTESDREREAAARKEETQDDESPDHTDDEGTIDTSSEADVAADDEIVLEKPSQAASGPENEEPKSPNPGDAFSFNNKRLCERWLDNLFMVLYEVSLASSPEWESVPG
jgi:hypothetical protein